MITVISCKTHEQHHINVVGAALPSRVLITMSSLSSGASNSSSLTLLFLNRDLDSEFECELMEESRLRRCWSHCHCPRQLSLSERLGERHAPDDGVPEVELCESVMRKMDCAVTMFERPREFVTKTELARRSDARGMHHVTHYRITIYILFTYRVPDPGD